MKRYVTYPARRAILLHQTERALPVVPGNPFVTSFRLSRTENKAACTHAAHVEKRVHLRPLRSDAKSAPAHYARPSSWGNRHRLRSNATNSHNSGFSNLSCRAGVAVFLGTSPPIRSHDLGAAIRYALSLVTRCQCRSRIGRRWPLVSNGFAHDPRGSRGPLGVGRYYPSRKKLFRLLGSCFWNLQSSVFLHPCPGRFFMCFGS
jgi:hypothetical protein